MHNTLFWLSLFLNKSLFSLLISVFPSLFLVQIGRFFHRQYLWSFGFPSKFPHQVLEVFHQLIFCPVFFLSFLIIGLEGFLSAIWLLETYQLSYRARMFLVVFRFSSPVSFIKLGDFLPGFHSSSSSTILCLVEFASKKRGNCNNVTFGAKNSWSRSHMTTTNHDFTSSGFTSITALGSFLFMP